MSTIAEGIKKGKLEEKKKMVLGFLNQGVDELIIKTVAEISDADVEKIKKSEM